MTTKEKQYFKPLMKSKKNYGFSRFGLMSNDTWINNPIRTVFCMSRYKFVAKMLSGQKNVLEVGSADGFYSRIVNQQVKNLTIIDFDPIFIKDFKSLNDNRSKINAKVHDIIKKPFKKSFNAIYSLDVLEHINPKKEKNFFVNCIKSLDKNGIFIVGMPSLESQKYASKQSKEGHVNCKSGTGLKKVLSKYFINNFIFSMNDEVVHTGFCPMSHYLIGIGCGVKDK